MMWLLVAVGCAECRHDEELVSVIGAFPSVDEAKAAVQHSGRWQVRRDDGGAYTVDSQGGYEILPIPST